MRILGILLALALSRAFSFAWNYLGRGEFRQVKLRTLMVQPYGRVIILHVTILGGGSLMQALHSPTAGLLILILLKIGLDLAAHLRERNKFSETTEAGSTT